MQDMRCQTLPAQQQRAPQDSRKEPFTGVVGLAIGRSLALNGQSVLIVEQAKAIGTETSSRNSEVIHSGMPSRRGMTL